MLAARVPTILPLMTFEEAIEVTRIHCQGAPNLINSGAAN